ncbi:23S rRNA (uracil(1939)-C(5))-methyltransferase RlmD [Massilibacterium senegalense]|uniref:23S rRNA (uracil(1939)-C(5))-methyltransferase RlmD n=1 Tax=Massilibacterium senegalense TaxID=1632858 RepID=UPI003898D993
MMKQQQSKKTVLVTIKRLGINGEGVGFYKKKIIFIPGALPNEEVFVRITKEHPKFLEGELVRVKTKSNERIKPACAIYEKCGGCQLQHMTYAAQLKAKKDIVKQAFERYTSIKNLPIHDTIGMDEPWNYRNKSQLQIGEKKGNYMAGLYAAKSHQLIELTNCPVQHPDTNKVTEKVKRILQQLRIPVYKERTHSGIVRTVVVRTSFYTKEVQVVIVTATKILPKKEQIITEITRQLPNVTSIVQNINTEKTSVIFGNETIVLAGNETITEKLGSFSFDLSARAFFQLNPVQTVTLYNEAKKAAQLTGNEKVVDAYCGVGTIGLWLADGAKEVRGMDVIKESVMDAQENMKKHGVAHATYVVGKAETWLPKWKKEGFDPDVIVVDPPRTGCDKTFLQTVIDMNPKRFVYVSCNPSTLAKDVDYLVERGFELKSVQPVDMFPQTAHCEVVCLLQRLQD